MPLYMDVHNLAGATAKDVVEAHKQDMAVQDKYGVKYLTYWFNEAAGKVFCLTEAPNVNAAVAVHREAHGLLADDIMEVEAGTVEGFLGNVADTAVAKEPEKPSAESAFRTIMFTDIEESTALTQRVGDAKAMDLLRIHDEIVRGALKACDGREVKHMGDGFMNCFTSAAGAVECSIAIQSEMAAYEERSADWPIRVRIGLSAGEPVEQHRDLFGAAVQMAARICAKADASGILVSNVIRELSIGKVFTFADRGETELRGFTEPVRLHEVLWRDAG